MEESEIFLVIILLVQKQLISIRYLILIFIVVISVLTKGFLSTTLFNKLVCFRFFFVMDDKTYIRLVKIGYRNYSVSPRWYSTPLRVVEYHRLDWIILDIHFYLVEYLFIIIRLAVFIDSARLQTMWLQRNCTFARSSDYNVICTQLISSASWFELVTTQAKTRE